MECKNCDSIRFRKYSGSKAWSCSSCGTVLGDSVPPDTVRSLAPDIVTGDKLGFRDCVRAESRKKEIELGMRPGEWGGADRSIDGRKSLV